MYKPPIPPQEKFGEKDLWPKNKPQGLLSEFYSRSSELKQ